MSRDLHANTTTEVQKSAVHPIGLVKAEFDSGDLCLWTGLGELTWDSQIWTGAGNLLTLSSVEETTDLKATSAEFMLSGMPSSLLDLAENEDYQGRPITVWIGFLDDAGAIVSNPYPFFKGRMDTMPMRDEGDTCTIKLTAETRLIDLERARVRRYTPEDQKLTYSADTFFDHVASLQDMEITLE